MGTVRARCPNQPHRRTFVPVCQQLQFTLKGQGKQTARLFKHLRNKGFTHSVVFEVEEPCSRTQVTTVGDRDDIRRTEKENRNFGSRQTPVQRHSEAQPAGTITPTTIPYLLRCMRAAGPRPRQLRQPTGPQLPNPTPAQNPASLNVTEDKSVWKLPSHPRFQEHVPRQESL